MIFNSQIAKKLRNSSTGNRTICKALECSLNVGEASKNLALKSLEAPGNEYEDCYGTFKKLVRNSEYSKSDDFKKLSVMAQILKKSHH